MRIDLNADLGEGCGDDAAMLGIVSSANIACGGHAGNDISMRRACLEAAARGVRIGAHPSYPDRAGFGRVRLGMEPDKLRVLVRDQITRLVTAAHAVGAEVSHVKPHGALYNAVTDDPLHADAVIAAITDVVPGTTVLHLPGSPFVAAAEAKGLHVVGEAFADRAYLPDGTLVPRSRPGAVLHDPDLIARRAWAMVQAGEVDSFDGQPVRITARSLCVHGDTPGAVGIARRVRRLLEDNGVTIEAFA